MLTNMKAQFCKAVSIAAALAAVCASVGCGEAVDEVTNNLRCDDVCEYAVGCGLVDGTIDACDDTCQEAGDDSQVIEDRIENCAACLDYDDRTCSENNTLCTAECEGIPPINTTPAS